MMVVSEAEAELQREVEELKLRLHMAAEHYKEKYRECQRLRRQVAKLNTTESQGEPKRNASTETIQEPLTPSPESPTAGNIVAAVLQEAAEMTITRDLQNRELMCTDTHISTETEDMQRQTMQEERVEAEGEAEANQKDDDENEAKEKEEKKESLPEESLRMTSWVEVENERPSAEEDTEAESEPKAEEEERGGLEEQAPPEAEARNMGEAEKEQTRSVEEELAMMEEKWREQCAINETLKQRLANEEERFRVQMAERASEVTELKRNLAQALRDKEQLQEELQRFVCRQREQEAGVQGAEVRQPMVLRYPLPYPQDPSPPPLVPQRPAELQYGNPYSTDTTRDRVDVALSPEHMTRPPPEAPPCAPPCAPPISPRSPEPGAPGWEQEVVCIQPSRSTSPPESLEHPPEEPRSVADGAQPSCDHQSSRRGEARGSFCFDSSNDVHKRCPLCEVIFPPHFEQRSFEQHVESHWKVCPVCSEQFPLNCQQQLFERHVLTHFDGHVLNFEQIE